MRYKFNKKFIIFFRLFFIARELVYAIFNHDNIIKFKIIEISLKTAL